MFVLFLLIACTFFKQNHPFQFLQHSWIFFEAFGFVCKHTSVILVLVTLFLYIRDNKICLFALPRLSNVSLKWLAKHTQVNLHCSCSGVSQAANAFCYYIQRHAWLQTPWLWRLPTTSLPGVFSFISASAFRRPSSEQHVSGSQMKT